MSVFSDKRTQIEYLLVSFLGLVVLIGMKRSLGISQFTFQHVLYLASFSVICIIGLAAAVMPGKLGFSSHGDHVNHESRVLGHHPDCGRFGGHVLFFNGVGYCAGCMGLAVGSFMTLVGLVLYFLLSFSVPGFVFWGGIFLISLGLLQHFIDLGVALIHFLLNVVFVLGAFLLVISLDFIGAGVWVELYSLGLIVFWILARIRISQEEHVGTCAGCGLGCDLSFENG